MKNCSGRIKKTILFFLCLTLILIVSFGMYLINPLSFNVSSENVNRSIDIEQRTKINELVIVELKGTPYEMGYQHGKLLKREIHGMIEVFTTIMELEMSPTSWIKSIVLNYLTLSYFHATPDKYLQEIKGIAEGADVTVKEIFLLNIFDELFNLAQCTNVAVWDEFTFNGEIVHGRNLDYDFQKYLWNRQVVFVYQPVDGQKIVSISWPGYMGVLTGMNENGLTLGSMTSKSNKNSFSGVPSGILYRHLLHTAKTIKEAEGILLESSRTIGNNLMITSKIDGYGVVFELNAEKVVMRNGSSKITATNHFNILENKKISKGSEYRQRRAEDLCEEFKLFYPMGHNEMIEILADSVIEDGIRATIGNSYNVQSVVFLPMRKEIWVGVNDVVPAADGVFWGFKFDPHDEKLLKLIDRTKVQHFYLESQSYFHRDDLSYWTDERIKQVISRYLELGYDHLYMQEQIAGFYLAIEKYDQAIEIFSDLLQKKKYEDKAASSEDYLDYLIRQTSLELKLAKAYFGDKRFEEAKKLVEELDLKENIPEYLSVQIEKMLADIQNHL